MRAASKYKKKREKSTNYSKPTKLNEESKRVNFDIVNSDNEDDQRNEQTVIEIDGKKDFALYEQPRRMSTQRVR